MTNLVNNKCATQAKIYHENINCNFLKRLTESLPVSNSTAPLLQTF